MARYVLPAGLVATLGLLLVLFYFPVGIVLVEAVAGPEGLTVGPILRLLRDPFYQWDLFGFTIYQALLSTLASVALGLPGAYLIARFEFPGRRTLRSLTILPFITPAILVAVGFLTAFGQNGLVNDLLRAGGLRSLNLVFSLELIVIAHAFYNAPLVIRFVAAAWEGVDARRVETARALGAPPRRAFRDVIFPQLLPALGTAALLAFLFSFMSFPIVLALGGLQFATVEVWLFGLVRQYDLTTAAALATLEIVFTLGITYVYLRYEARTTTERGGTAPLDRRRFFIGARTFTSPVRAGLMAYGLVAVVVFVVPLVSLIVESVTGPDGQLTLRYYEFLATQQVSTAIGTVRPLPAVINSLTFAVGTLLVALPMGVLIAYLTTQSYRGRAVVGAILLGPLAVSGIVIGLGLLRGLVFGVEIAGYRVTATGAIVIVMAHAVAAYPFVTRAVAPRLDALDGRFVESARTLGASRARALIDIELPLVATGLIAGTAFAFAISVGEFDSTVILAEGAETFTMPVALERYVGNRALGPDLGAAAAMGTVLLFVTSVSFLVIDRVGDRIQPVADDGNGLFGRRGL